MKLVFALLTQSVSIDQFTNRLSLFNVIEGIQAPQFPTIVPELVFVAVLRRGQEEPARFDATLTVKAGETLIGRAILAVDFEGKLTTRLIGNFQGMPVLSPGTLEFVLPLPNADQVVVSLEAIQNPAPMTG